MRPAGIRSHKDGFFQRLSLTATFLEPGSGTAGFGLTTLESYATFAVPMPTREMPLLITPGYNRRLLDGPLAPDLPSQLHDAYLSFLWLPRFSESWGAVLSVSPGVYSDFEKLDSDAIRIVGRALARYHWDPDHLELVFGLLYLDRADVSLLPAGGVIWTPNGDTRYEILFPKPKLAHRVACEPHREVWWYLAGEFGGDTWQVQRTGGATDTVTLRDLRVLLGLESKFDGGAGWRCELGYVFARSVEYESATPDFTPDGTFLVRGGITY